MGFELEAFLGRASELGAWQSVLPSVVVCPLSGELGMVPLTGTLILELRAYLGEAAIQRFASERRLQASAAVSNQAYMMAWGMRASSQTTVAYVSLYEFGDHGSETVILWSNGKQLQPSLTLEALLAYFRDQLGMDIDPQQIDLEQQRGELAAAKWAATSILNELVGKEANPR